MNYNSVLTISITTVIIAAFLFISGNSILMKSVFGVPSGNFILWFGLITLQTSNYSINKGFKTSKTLFTKIIKVLSLVFIAIAILWFAIAYLIAGNVSFNFNSNTRSFVGSPEAGILHRNIIYVLSISPIALIILYKVSSFIENRKHKN